MNNSDIISEKEKTDNDTDDEKKTNVVGRKYELRSLSHDNNPEIIYNGNNFQYLPPRRRKNSKYSTFFDVCISFSYYIF